MEDNEIKEFVSRKMAEAKLEVAESRLKFLLWIAGALMTIFGVFLPLLLTNRSSEKLDTALYQMRQEINQTSQNLRNDSKMSVESIRADVSAEMDRQSKQLDSEGGRVDFAIKDMQKQFKELAGTQLRKPLLECSINGSNLEGAVLKFTPGSRENIKIINVGDAPAQKIRIRCYSNFKQDEYFIQGEWRETTSDEPSYSVAFDYIEFTSLDPKEARNLNFDIDRQQNAKLGSYPCLIKIFYEQPEPKKYSFTINFENK